MSKHNLSAQHITKIIKNKELLHDVSLNLEGGNIYGFTGENGSGKTMLFRVLSGLVKPTHGQVLLNGEDVHKAHSSKIGVIIENSSMWPDLTGIENLSYLGSIRSHISKEEVISTLQRVGLDPQNKLPIKKYSLGMKQRLLIAQAIMEKPEFIFLDEPTNAIDQEGVRLVHQIIQEEAKRGAVVLMASHISQDISSLCREVYRMESGHCERLEV